MNTPGFWQYEQSGRLRPVVVAYLHGKPLDDEQVTMMRAYLRQWINADVWRNDPGLDQLRTRIDELVDRASIDRWLSDALDLGIDPL
jgi:hypothetical protein